MKSKMNIKSIIIMCILCIISLFFINKSFASNIAKITVETANLRETASEKGKIVALLSINQEVEILENEGQWYKVKYNNYTGYVRQDLLALPENNQNIVANQTETQNTTNEIAKTAEDTQANLQTTNTENQANTIEEEQGGTQDATTKEETKVTYVVSENCKLKMVPLINSTSIVEVKKDEEVTQIEKINGWVCVETQNTKGWIREEKMITQEEKQKQIEEVKKQEEEKKAQEQKETEEAQKVAEEEKKKNELVEKTQYINTASANLRTQANTSSEVLRTLTMNTQVQVIGEENGWSKVKVGEKEGYISTSLLSNTKKETSRASEISRKKEEQTQAKTTQEVQTVAKPVPGSASSVVSYAQQYIGSRYIYGGTTPSGFDCSGFTSYVYKQFGISLNRTAAGQYSNGAAVTRSELAPGDLVMFGRSGINHVGIYIGGGRMVHAANASRGVTTDTINAGYYNNNYVGARRVM